MDYAKYALTDDETLSYPSYPLDRDFPKEEHELRISRARELMAGADRTTVLAGPKVARPA